MTGLRDQYEANKTKTKIREQEQTPIPLWWLGERDPIARFTLYVAVFTLFLVTLGGLQYCVLQQADETSRAGLRASVAMVDVVVGYVGESDQASPGTTKTMYSVAAIWKNSGHTPTRNLVIDNNTHFDFGQVDPAFPNLAAAEAAGQRNPFKTTLAPETTMTGQVNYFTGPALEAAKDKAKASFYLYGIARYEDVFDTRYLTLACHRIIPPPINYLSPQSNMIEIHGGLCREYNCTDDECRRYSGIPQIAKLLEYLN